jgi:hypothetical protein
MSLCRTWRQDTGKPNTSLDQTGLRYDAGDWFAEILGDTVDTVMEHYSAATMSEVRDAMERLK